MFNLSADRAIHSFSANMENEDDCSEVVYGVVADAGVVHHWDGSLDDAFGGGGCEGGASLGRFFVMASLRFGYQKNASQLMAPV